MNLELNNFIAENTQNNWQPPADVPRSLFDSDWPWAPIVSTDYDPAPIFQELVDLNPLFVPHRDKDKIHSYNHEGWHSLTLHGIGESYTENYDRYGFSSQQEADYRWTQCCERAPNLINLIRSFPFTNYGRIRIMRLAPGGFIMPHTDGRGRIFGPFNFALNNPEGCSFVFEKYGRVPFESGRGFMLDLGIKHAVLNNSNSSRYHVIIHGHQTPGCHQRVTESLKLL